MLVKNISLTNFRNIEKTKVEFNSNVNILVGKNGQGKTSFLEAIYTLALTKSFRSGAEDVLLQHGKQFFEIKGNFLNPLSDNIQLRLFFSAADGKNVFFNGNKLNRYSELIGVIPVTLLSMEDLELSFGAPAYRRRFMDILLAQTSSLYLKSLQVYRKSLQQRNRLLSLISDNKESVKNLSPWDEQLARYGSEIVAYRISLLSFLNSKLDIYYKNISQTKDSAAVRYKSTLIDRKEKFLKEAYQQRYLNLLQKNYALDIQRKSTTSGLHRDDLLFLKNGLVIKTHGSQGENKTFLIALKLAERDFIREKTAKQAVLLLDDVFGELDKERIHYLMKHIVNEGQTFITTTLVDKFETVGLESAHFFKIEAGTIIQ